jgi:tRNA-splicing ligase RtcB
MTGADLPPNIGRIMDEVADTISFGIGRKNAERVDSAVLDKAQDGWNLEATRPLYQKAGAQLGTVGSGNHYVDIFTDEDDRVWVGATLDPAALVTELPLGFSRQPARKTAWTLSRVFWT